jgi:hypothetical protein
VPPLALRWVKAFSSVSINGEASDVRVVVYETHRFDAMIAWYRNVFEAEIVYENPMISIGSPPL